MISISLIVILALAVLLFIISSVHMSNPLTSS